MDYNEMEHFDKTFQKIQSDREKSLREKQQKALDAEIKSINAKYKTEFEKSQALAKFKEAQEKKLQADLKRDEASDRAKARAIETAYKKSLLASVSASERAQILKASALKKIEDKKLYQQQAAQAAELQKIMAEAAPGIDTASLQAEYKKLIDANKSLEASIGNIDIAEATAFDDLIDSVSAVLNDKGASKEEREAAQETLAAAKALAATPEQQKKVSDQQKALSDKNFKAEADDRKQAAKDRNQQKKDEMRLLLKTEEGRTQLLKNATAAMVNGLSKAFDDLEEPINTFYQYQAKYEARLQGSENHYNKMMQEVSKQLGLSPFVSQKKMVENLQKLIDTGTNYNVELRAYIATVSENIASTFDAFDSNLLRLIRIQQNDSTAARMGMEAALTKVLNNMFSDTSYLSGTSDTVSGYLLDASAQLSHQMAAEFEFVTQKWLGALYALGVGDQTITNIAQGLGYIGSGNIEALNSNESLMSLLAMSAAKGGTSISDLLTGNLTADTTNKLLKGMIELLSDIADNTDSNKVTKAAFANVFGVTNTDLRSISNLTASDINKLYSTNLNYSGALSESATQLSTIYERMHISTMVENLMENATTNSALMIGSTAPTYVLYKALKTVSNLVGDRGLEIPGIQAMGTGTASGIDILSVAKAGVAGTALLAGLISSIGNLGSGGLPALSEWSGYEQSMERGTGLILGAGVQSGFSQSSQYNSVGNSSAGDMTKASMQTANNSAVENMSEADKALQDESKEMPKNVKAMKELLDKLVDAEANAIRVSIEQHKLPNNIPVSLVAMDSSVEEKLQRALSIILAGNFADGLEGNGSGASLVDVIKAAMTDVNVRITNDYFDDFYQKQSYNLGNIL